ncbi:hypothetical protein [Microvirga sp. KLBC 81]|uniref:hypothetical protein n=1 Tax=Microvirga sp. KLBC 81 TaxID=1862707 RepID=UPI00197B1612|nr:hypothetical protein [Microvirga sp. KLBC 81]
MHTRSYIWVLAIALGLSVASGASALEIANGLSTNGLSTNGLSTNGLSTNGLSTNGLSTNGLSTNGLSTNGQDDKGAVSSGMQLEAAVLRDGSFIPLGH